MSENLSTPVNSTSSNSAFQNDRRRRDNINERIQELLELIPEDFFDGYYLKSSKSSNASSPNNLYGNIATTPKPKSTGTRDGKPNKGQILTQAVELITKLQNEVDTKNREEVDLMMKVQRLSKKTGTILNDINLENTSAEVELAKIGVGPLAGVKEGANNPNNTYNQNTGTTGQTQYDYGGYAEYADGV